MRTEKAPPRATAAQDKFNPKLPDVRLRDLLACFVLLGCVIRGTASQNRELDIDWCAGLAYEVADSVLEDRGRKAGL